LEVVRVEGDDVSETVIFTAVEFAGTVNLYHASGLLPHPMLVAEALYKVPAVGEQSPPTVNVAAVPHVA
jgi:hypothetical protein